MSNYVKFQSTHHTNYGTSITVTKNYLILDDKESLAILDLSKIDITSFINEIRYYY